MLVKDEWGNPLYIGNAAFTCIKVPSGRAGLNFDFSPKFTSNTVIIKELFEDFMEKLERLK